MTKIKVLGVIEEEIRFKMYLIYSNREEWSRVGVIKLHFSKQMRIKKLTPKTVALIFWQFLGSWEKSEEDTIQGILKYGKLLWSYTLRYNFSDKKN